MACTQKNPLLLAKKKTFRGREGINLLVHSYCSMLSIFLSFLSNSSFLFFSFSFSIFAYFLVILSLRLLLPLSFPMHGKGPLYNVCHDWLLPFQPLTTFVWSGCTCRPLLVRLCQLRHSPSPEKEDYFVCLFAVAPLPVAVWMLSLSIPYGMHLVVLSHPCFFWVVCHSSKTFPPKEPE